jgi:hypothetical protein
MEGLPAAPVTWVEVQEQYHDVVISTYGRGLYILRDITRLEQADRVAANAPLYVYEPRPGFRQARSGSAEFLYTMASAPTDSVNVEILDAGGKVVRTMKATGRAGLNRATWDLRYDSPTQIGMRTVAPDNPDIWAEPRFKDKDTRPVVHWGIEGAMRAGPLASPGNFTVRVSANGQSQSKPFEVIRDPAIRSSDQDLAASTAAQVKIRDDMNATAEIVNRLEIMRKQIEDQLAANRGKRDVERALNDLDSKMMAVELQLLSRSDMHSDDKWFVEAYKVYLNLVWLNGQVGTGAGDVAGGADYRPTNAQMQVLQLVETDLSKAKTDFDTLLRTDLAEFNRKWAGKIPQITDRPPRTTT